MITTYVDLSFTNRNLLQRVHKSSQTLDPDVIVAPAAPGRMSHSLPAMPGFDRHLHDPRLARAPA